MFLNNTLYVASVLILSSLLTGCYGDSSRQLSSESEGEVKGSQKMELIAGSFSGKGFLNGPLSIARFNGPSSIVATSNGSFLVVDKENCAVRKISQGIVSTYAGGKECEEVDGDSQTARLSSYVKSMSIDSQDNLYIIENDSVRKISSDGSIQTLLTSPGGNRPSVVVAKSPTDLYVATVYPDKIIYKAHKETNGSYTLTVIAGASGNDWVVDGNGTSAGFRNIYSMSIGDNGVVYLADYGSIRRLDVNGDVTTIAGHKISNMFENSEATVIDGNINDSRFPSDTDIFYRDGIIYAVHKYHFKVRQINLNIATSSAEYVTTLAGTGSNGSQDGSGAQATFDEPQGLASDAAGNLFFADNGNNSIRKILNPVSLAQSVVSTYTGIARTYVETNTALTSRYYWTNGLGVQNNGSVKYIAGDYLNIVSANGSVKRIDIQSYDSESESRLIHFNDLLYFNSYSQIIRVNADDSLTELIPANLTYVGGAHDGESIQDILDMDIAADGTIYISKYNDFISKLTLVNGQYQASVIQDNVSAKALKVDSKGNILFVDTQSGSLKILTLSNGAYVESTLFETADSSHPASDGINNGDGRFKNVYGYLAKDSSDNFYVVDDRTVRKINKKDNVWTLTTVLGQLNSFTAGAVEGNTKTDSGLVAMGSIGDIYVHDDYLYLSMDSAIARVKF